MHSSQYPEEDHHEECIPLDENAVRAQEVDRNMRQEIRYNGKRPREAYNEMLNPKTCTLPSDVISHNLIHHRHPKLNPRCKQCGFL